MKWVGCRRPTRYASTLPACLGGIIAHWMGTFTSHNDPVSHQQWLTAVVADMAYIGWLKLIYPTGKHANSLQL